MIYEWRTYKIKPARLPHFVARYGKDTGQIGAYKRHGFNLFGAWTEEIGTGGEFTYILKWEDQAERDKKWPGFVADEAWAKERAETETDGPWVHAARNTYLTTTPYSPEPKITTRVQELRIYEPLPGKMGALNNRMANHAIPCLKKHGMEIVGFWTAAIGINSQLVWMLGYDSLGDREKSWAGFLADPEWLNARDESEKDGALVGSLTSAILRPPAYLVNK